MQVSTSFTSQTQYDPMVGQVYQRGFFGKAVDWFLDSLIYLPPKPPTKLNEKTVRWIEPSNVPHSRIPISIHNPRKRKRKSNDLIAIFSPANASDLGLTQPLLQKLADKLHITVIGYEYLGYGFSTFDKKDKFPSTIGIEQSIESVYQYMTSELNIDPSKIVLMGHSMGTAACLSLARKVHVAGTILMSSFKSVLQAHSYTNWGCLTPEDFMLNIEMIDETIDETPVFLIHGTEDKIIPIQNSYDLAKKIEDTRRYYPPFWVEGMGHNDLLDETGLSLMQPKILEFLERLNQY